MKKISLFQDWILGQAGPHVPIHVRAGTRQGRGRVRTAKVTVSEKKSSRNDPVTHFLVKVSRGVLTLSLIQKICSRRLRNHCDNNLNIFHKSFIVK